MSLSCTLLFAAAASALIPCCRAQITVEKPIPSKAQIDIDAGKTAGAPIPRTLFGSFLEPIGNSTYNGLWAELLVNPSLEENLWSARNLEALVHDRPELSEASALGLPLPWEPLDPKQGNRYEPRWGNAANSWRSLVVMGVPEHPTGIKQQVRYIEEPRIGDLIVYYSDMRKIQSHYPKWQITKALPQMLREIAAAWQQRMSAR